MPHLQGRAISSLLWLSVICLRFAGLVDWRSWTASTHAASSFWCNRSNIPTHSCSCLFRGPSASPFPLVAPCFCVHRGHGVGQLSGPALQLQSRHGWEQGRAACTPNRECDRLASPKEITLFWARGDDIMTDGNEDVGARSRKLYLTWWHREDGDTHMHINTCGSHCSSLILQWTRTVVTPHWTHICTCGNTHLWHVHSSAGSRRWLSVKRHKSDTEGRSLWVTVGLLSLSTAQHLKLLENTLKRLISRRTPGLSCRFVLHAAAQYIVHEFFFKL